MSTKCVIFQITVNFLMTSIEFVSSVWVVVLKNDINWSDIQLQTTNSNLCSFLWTKPTISWSSIVKVSKKLWIKFNYVPISILKVKKQIISLDNSTILQIGNICNSKIVLCSCDLVQKRFENYINTDFIRFWTELGNSSNVR